MICLTCNKETTNPKFCSRSCSVIYNNKLSPKRRLTKQCKLCEVLIPSNRTFCPSCYGSSCRWRTITIGDLQGLAKYQISAYIRDIARRAYKSSGKPKECIRCHYDIHYEVCHIKPIKDFVKSNSVAEVNDISNLIALCRNCHWEFDHGLLKL